MKNLFLFFILLLLITSSHGQSSFNNWVITNDTIKGKINWVLDDMVSITENKDNQTQILYLKDIYKYYFEGKIKYGTAPIPIIRENWVITKDTIWGRINWDYEDMLSITQVKDSQTLILYKKDIYKYFFMQIIKLGSASKPETIVIEKIIPLSDSLLYQNLIKHDKLLIENKNRLDNIQINLTLFHQQYRKGKMINICSITIPTTLGLIGYSTIQTSIKDLDSKLEPTKQSRDATLATYKSWLNNGQISPGQYNDYVMTANLKYDADTKDIQNQIEKKQKSQRNFIIGSSVVSCIGVIIGTSIINGAYQYIGKAGEFTVDLNKITYTYKF